MGFVLSVHFITKSAPFTKHIKYHGHIFNRMILDQFYECCDKTVRCGCVLSPGIDQWPIDKYEMGAVGKSHRIQQIKCLSFFGHPIES